MELGVFCSENLSKIIGIIAQTLIRFAEIIALKFSELTKLCVAIFRAKWHVLIIIMGGDTPPPPESDLVL